MPASRPRKSEAAVPDEVVMSDELHAPVSTGVELCYQTFGKPEDEPLLLVMGLGGPMTWWDPELCKTLAAKGFYVIRYDNRDTGRSSHGTGRVTRTMLVRAFAGLLRTAPYALADLRDDAFGLLDHLGIDRANVLGVSMGGMIVQAMAIGAPERVTSMVSVMSTTGRRSVGWLDPRLFPSLLAPRQRDREAYIDYSTIFWDKIGSPAYPTPHEQTRAKAATTWDRGVNGAGVLRQMLAVVTQPDRSRALASTRVPSAVVHGSADKMVHVSGGRATARAIPDCELLVVEGMGHDLPPALFEMLADIVRRTADRGAR